MRKLSTGHNSRKWLWPLFFLAPYCILYLVFNAFPVVYSFAISLTDWRLLNEPKFVGLDNYIQLVTVDKWFWKSIFNTGLLMLLYIPASIIVALLLSNLIYSKGVRFKKFFQLAYFLPHITTAVAIGLMFALIFDWQTGVLNQILIQAGLLDEGLNWLGTPGLARFVTGLMLFWSYFGYCTIFYLAGLSAIPEEMHEAATLDGANAWQELRHVTIPMLKSITNFLVVTSIISGSQIVEEPMLLLNGWATVGAAVGGPQRSCLTAVWYLYDIAFGKSGKMDYSKGAAIGYLTFLIIMTFVLIRNIIAKRRNRDEQD